MVQIKAFDQKRMRSNFSAHANEYDTYAAVQKRVVAGLSRKIGEEGSSIGRLLDIGTGTGALAAACHESSPDQTIFVMDIAHGMTVCARQRLPKAIACDADAMALPFSDDTFDLAVSSSVYQWVNPLSAAFAEVARVLKPKGLFVVALFGDQTLYELRSAHRSALDSCTQKRLSHVHKFPSAEEVSESLQNAGLDTLSLVSRMEVEYHVDVPELLRQLKRIGASNVSNDRPRGLASRKVIEKMVRFYEERHRGSLGLPASYEVITAVAAKSM